MVNIIGLKKSFTRDLKEARDFVSLESVYKKYLGVKKGELTLVLRSLKGLPPAKKKKLGQEANQIKGFMMRELGIRKGALKKQRAEDMLGGSAVDVTAPGKKPEKGHEHPLTKVIEDIEDIFGRMGFEVATGPHVETEFYNFDALNIPPDHPAREMWDTFWLRSNQNEGKRKKEKGKKNERLLLRTHTSPVQIRYMETHQPPFRIIAPGLVFRYEATDASHHFNFYQLEGLMVARNVSVGNFKAVITHFFREFFKKEVHIRLRPSYFPFVEPGFEVDMSCMVCEGRGCSTCAKKGWLEMMGAGMVHPNVFRAVGYNPKFVRGFAFGMGVDRLSMMKYKIDDVRLFYSGDMRFLTQF